MIKDKLATIRKSKGWTQNDLAERSGYSRSSIINWETGKRAPRTVDIERLAIALGVSPSDFLEVGNSNDNQEIHKNVVEPYQDNQDNIFAYWGGVLDRARMLAKNKDMQEIGLITPLLQSALNILLSVQEHEVRTQDEITQNISLYSGNSNSYNGNTVNIKATV